VGKWHLHTGSFPQIGGPDYVPEGRDRLGFQHWRGYNFHTDYFNGSVNLDNWRCERWKGYETKALNYYSMEFMDSVAGEPFCLFISPHQPHATPHEFAPQEYYDRLPDQLTLPANVAESQLERSLHAYRHYLAMSLALDDMVDELLDYLEQKGLADNTIFVFTSDHGTQMGAHGWDPWKKKVPYEESLLVPMIVRWPGTFDENTTCDVLTSPVDLFPSLCGLCDVPLPRTVEGYDLSAAWRGEDDAFQQDAVLIMNFTTSYDYLVNGEEWRGVRTRDHSYARWLNGKIELFDLRNDPLQMKNLAGNPEHRRIEESMQRRLSELMDNRSDALIPCTDYSNWFDEQRRVVRNVYGPLRDTEVHPDWSLLS
jgi:arylsulfatase A-like enzyme